MDNWNTAKLRQEWDRIESMKNGSTTDLNGVSTLHSLIIIADRINPSRVTSGMGFEKVLRNACKKAGVLCIRSDYKNNVPDFLISNRYGEYVYLECKFYGSIKQKSCTKLPALYMSKQKKQYQAFKKLAKRSPIYFLTVSKERDDTKPKGSLIELLSEGKWLLRGLCDL